MVLQESGEMYLEAIYVLSQGSSEVHAIEVGQYLGYSKPSVSRAIGILKAGGYITLDERSHIHLTETGLCIAQKIYERHTLLTTLLVSLGVPDDIAASDACRIEHAISDCSFDAIKEYFSKHSAE